MKNIFFLFILAALYGCDMVYRMTANGDIAYRSHSECGKIVITGISGTAADHIYMCMNGDFMLYPDSLRILRTPYDENQVTRIYLGDSLISQKDSISIEGEGKLEINFRGGLPIHYGDRRKDYIGRTIKISPSNFIRCNGKPILTDTVLFWIDGMKSIMVFAWSKKVPDGI
jgi:hypothetical protein